MMKRERFGETMTGMIVPERRLHAGLEAEKGEEKQEKGTGKIT